MQNLNHSIHNQVKNIFDLTIQNLLTSFSYDINKQQAILFHLSNLTPRLNKVCLRRESKQTKKEIAEIETSLKSLRNDLVDMLKTEFSESAKHRRDFAFNIDLSKPIEKVQIKSSNVWSSISPYTSFGSFNLDKLSSEIPDDQKQNHYFSSGGIGRVNFLEVR